jgi:large subunit ribosomal protein L20
VPRVKRGTHRRASRKKVLEQASGYFLTKSKLYRAAQEAVERGLKFAYVGRKLKKREYRSLWIVRINASCRAAGVSYSQFVRGLKAAGLDLNRKVLADIALHDDAGFLSLVHAAKAALEAKPGPDAEPEPEGRHPLAEPEPEARHPLAEPAPEAKPALEAEPAAESEPPENA